MTDSAGTALRVVGARFERSDPLHFYDAGDLTVRVGDRVLVEETVDSDDAPRVATVAVAPDQVVSHPFRSPLPRVLGPADS